MAGEDGFHNIRCQQAKLDIAIDMTFGELEMIGQGLLGGVFSRKHKLAPMVAEGYGFDEFQIWFAGLGALPGYDEPLLFAEGSELGGDAFDNEAGGVWLAGWRFTFKESE